MPSSSARVLSRAAAERAAARVEALAKEEADAAAARAAREHVDDGLARFRYAFSDGSTYHLNMFPLRHGYVRRLMREVGFQRITSYGDYQRGHDDPDFYVHVAEKEYLFDTDITAI